jgi:hypothetical protein
MLNDRLRAVTRKRTLLFLVLTLCIAGGLIGGRHTVRGLLFGPVKVDAQAFADHPQNYVGQYVELIGAESFDTGLSKVTVASEKLVWNVVGLRVNDTIVAVKTKGKKGFTSTKGMVEIDNQLRNRLLVSSFGRSLLLDSTLKLATFDINETAFDLGSVVIGVGLGFLALVFSLKFFLNSVRRLSNIAEHPLRQSLATNGATADDFIELDGESAFNPTAKLRKVTLLPNWAITEKHIAADAFRYSNVMWLYGKRTKQRLHFVIPIGSRYSTVIHTADGVTRTHDSRSKDVAASVLKALTHRTPWAVQGYSDELAAAWKDDRASFLQTVQSRAPKTVAGQFGSPLAPGSFGSVGGKDY